MLNGKLHLTMDLPIFKKQEEQPENFWSLVLGKNWVDSAIWRTVDEKTEIIAHGGAFPYQEGDATSLTEAADGSLSNAASQLLDTDAPKKVVFGIAPSQLEAGEIKKDFIEVLKVLSRELDLTPAGFVAIPEAITHLLKVQVGAPPNVILVGSSEEFLEVTLVQNGKVLGTTEVGRSMSTGQDLAEGLARLPEVPQYPTRVLVYNHKNADIEATKNNLLETEWEKVGLSFLHTPKVEVLPEDVVARAVSLAGGAETGHATELVEKPMATDGEEAIQQDSHEKTQEESPEESKEETLDKQEVSNVKTVSPEELGFKEGQDALVEAPSTGEFAVPVSSHLPQGPSSPVHEIPSVKRNLPLKIFSLASRLRIPSMPYLALPAVLLGIVGLGLLYWFLPSAQVSVFIAPKTYEKKVEFAVNTQGEENIEGKIIPARVLEVEKTVNKETNTTGSAKVGDRAKGEVTIYRVGSQVTLPEGTILSAGGLKFTLDKDVTVASGSAGPDSLGKNKESATAQAADIGSEFNLSSGTSFKIGTFSAESMTAKNDKAFTGGSSREIAAVAKKDLENLEEDAKKELEIEANEALKERLDENEILIPAGQDTAITTKDFSNKVGDEAQTVSIKLVGKVKFFAISRTHIKELLSTQGQIPEGFSVKEQQLEVATSPKGENKYEANIKANLLPRVDPKNLTERIAGKSPRSARDILSTTPGFTRAEMKIKFKFPGPLSTLPRRAEKIAIEVVAER